MNRQEAIKQYREALKQGQKCYKSHLLQGNYPYLQVLDEILDETMVAGQKNEMNIMLVMPVLFIVVMKNMGDGLVDLSSPTGLLSVTAALALFILAYFVGQKITDIKL